MVLVHCTWWPEWLGDVSMGDISRPSLTYLMVCFCSLFVSNRPRVFEFQWGLVVSFLSNHLGDVSKPSSFIDYSSSMFLKDDPQWTAEFVEAGWNPFRRLTGSLNLDECSIHSRSFFPLLKWCLFLEHHESWGWVKACRSTTNQYYDDNWLDYNGII